MPAETVCASRTPTDECNTPIQLRGFGIVLWVTPEVAETYLRNVAKHDSEIARAIERFKRVERLVMAMKVGIVVLVVVWLGVFATFAARLV